MPLRFLAAVLLATALRADFDPAQWKTRRRVTGSGPVTRVTLDAALFDQAQESLADLRLIRDGAEVPYLLNTAVASVESADVAARLTNRESRAGGLGVTLEFDGKQIHNRLALATSRQDFRTKVRVESSDDGRAWAVVRAAAYVFRFKTDDGRTAEHLTVSYPDSRRRLLRLTFEDWPDASLLASVNATRNTASAASRSAIWRTERPALTPGREKKTGCFVADTGTTAPRDRLLVTSATPAVFHRSVTLEQSRDGKNWNWLAASALYRIADEESLSIEFAETRSRWLRLCVFQGDDEPLQLGGLRLEGIDREVIFAGGDAWLYSGNQKAAAPVYDLAKTAPAGFAASAVAGQLQATQANPAYAGPAEPAKAWIDRYPAFLYGGLAVAVLGLGSMAIRLLRTPA